MTKPNTPPKRQVSPRPGTIVRVPIGPDTFVNAVFVQEASYAVFRPSFKAADPVPPLRLANRMFTVPVMKFAVTSGRWQKSGAVSPELFAQIPQPRYYIQDQLHPDRWSIYSNGKISPATRQECLGLECMAAWEPEHVEARVRAELRGEKYEWRQGGPLA